MEFLSASVAPHWKVLYMKLKFVPFCSFGDTLFDKDKAAPKLSFILQANTK